MKRVIRWITLAHVSGGASIGFLVAAISKPVPFTPGIALFVFSLISGWYGRWRLAQLAVTDDTVSADIVKHPAIRTVLDGYALAGMSIGFSVVGFIMPVCLIIGTILFFVSGYMHRHAKRLSTDNAETAK